MHFKFVEVRDILDFKYIPTKKTGYSLNPGSYEVVDLNNTLKHILADNVKISVTIDDVRLKSNLKTNQTLLFTNKSFFFTILGLTQSHSYPLDKSIDFIILLRDHMKMTNLSTSQETIKFI